MANNEYGQRKKGMIGSVVDVITLIVVLALCAGVLAWFTRGFSNWDARTWFSTEEPDTQPITVPEEEPALAVGFSYNADTNTVTA